MDTINEKQHLNPKVTIEQDMIVYMRKNNNNYNKEFVKVLSKFSPNDSRLIDAIKEYYAYEIDISETEIIIEEKGLIEKHKDRVLNCQNGLFYLEDEDFKHPIKSYISFEFKDLNDAFNFWPDFVLSKVNDAKFVAINITTRLKWEHWEIFSIIGDINKALGINEDYIYGVTTKKNATNTKVDVFIS